MSCHITSAAWRWIHERVDGEHSVHQDMRAAIARGYERGKAEGDAEVEILIADRDRLAKRCEELREVGEMYRAEAERPGLQLGRTYAALPDDRLAALEQRVGALVEALLNRFDPVSRTSVESFHNDLAALRAPMEDDAVAAESTETTIAYQRRKVMALREQVATARRERDQAREAGIREAAHASRAARERDEAVGVLAEVSARMMDDESLCWCASARLPGEDHQRACTRARALVAGEAGLPRTYEAPGTIQSLRVKIECLESDLAEAQGEVVAERSKRVAAEHAAADTVDAMLRVERDCDALRARIAELEAREKGARWLLATAHITKSLTPPEWHSKREAWLAGGHAAPIPDPARGLIERAAKVLETYVPLSEDELIADLRAHLGGGA